MDKITVNKQELIDILKKNRDIHISEYEETFDEYQKDTIKIMQKLLREAKKVPQYKSIPTHISSSTPQSNKKDYDIAIGMLEFSIDETFEISQHEYKQFVLNEWSWSGNFELTKSMYLKD